MANVFINVIPVLRVTSIQRISACQCSFNYKYSVRGIGSIENHQRTLVATDSKSSTNKTALPKQKNNRFRPKPVLQDIDITHVLSSDRNNPDNFGTLSEDWKMLEKLKSLPEEEDDVVEMEFLDNKEGKTRLPLIHYARIIMKFIRQKKIGHAIDVMEIRMKEDRVKPDNYIYNLVITSCGRVGYVRKAFKLYNEMRKHGLMPTRHTYTALFNACANSPEHSEGLERASHLRSYLLQKTVPMNPIIYHAMIKAFGRCGDLETAFLLVDEMLENRIKVSNETFNFLLQSCISDKEKGFRHGLLVWRKMMEKRVRPDLYTFNLLLRCSRDCGLGDEASARQVVAVLLHAGQVHQGGNSVAVTSGLESKSQVSSDVAVPESGVGGGDPNLICRRPTLGRVVAFSSITLPEHRLVLMGGSRGVLEQMRLFNVKPDVKTLTQLLDQIPSNLPAEEELLRIAKQDKIKIDVDFCNMLIRKRCRRRHYQDAKEVLKIIQEENLRPDIITFGVLAMACQSECFAHELLEDIERVGYRPNVEIIGALLKNACYNRDSHFVIEMMKTLDREELKPSKIFINHLEEYYKFGTDIVNKQKTEGVLRHVRLDHFDEFVEHYDKWKQNVNVEEEPVPWKQFTDVHYEPQDLELINKGRVKNAKKFG